MDSYNAQHTKQYDVFLSHDWGVEQKNHKKVSIINEELMRIGFSTWFDEQRLGGNVQEQMAKGIDESKGMLCFITRQYMIKVNGRSGNDIDNCKMEFTYAVRRLNPSKMLTIILEPAMKDISKWEGVLNMNLGGDIYVDLSGNVEDHTYVSAQVKEIRKQLEFKGITPSQLTSDVKDLSSSLEENANTGDTVEDIKKYVVDVSKSLKEHDENGFKFTSDVKDLSSSLEENPNTVDITKYVVDVSKSLKEHDENGFKSTSEANDLSSTLEENANTGDKVDDITKYYAVVDMSKSLKELDESGFKYIEDLVICNDVNKLASLLEAKPEIVNMRNREDATPFLYAAGFGTIECMEVFVKYGANVGDVTRNNTTALYEAVYHNRQDNVTWLSKNHVMLSRVKETLLGYTPLHLAARHGNVQLIKILLEHKVDMAVQDLYGRTPLDIAKEYKKTSCIVELEK